MNLIAAAIIGIAIIVLLIAVCKVHPFLSLLAGSFTMAVCAGVEYDKAFVSFTSGVGSTIANVGLLIAFGSIIGTILFKSGGADTIVDTIMSKTPLQRLPWAMALIAFIVGIPMFFEVGVVILIPERKPWHHPGTRPARSHPNRNHLRSDLQQTRSQVGTDRRSGKQG